MHCCAATIFGQLWRLEPLPPEKKAMWRREMSWLLSVSDHIVELVPTWQSFPDGARLEVRNNGSLVVYLLFFTFQPYRGELQLSAAVNLELPLSMRTDQPRAGSIHVSEVQMSLAVRQMYVWLLNTDTREILWF